MTTPASTILTVFNLKGGTAKSTTSVSVAAAWAVAGYRCLLVDLDPQGTSSRHLGCRVDGEAFRDAMVNSTPLKDVIVETSSGVDLIPAGEWLIDVDAATAGKPLRELRLQRLLEPLRATYDFILLDCPPSPGLLNTSGLLASDGVLIPVEAQGAAVDGLIQAMGFLEELDAARAEPLQRLGVVVCKYDNRTTLSRTIDRALRDEFGDLICSTVIHHNVRIAEAYAHGQPVQLVDPRSRGALDYNKLGAELLKRVAS